MEPREGARWVGAIEADGLSIRVSTSGSGHPLVLIMGLGGHLDMWQPLEHVLNPLGIRTITYDAPGTGGSSAHRLPRRISGLARTTGRVLDGLGIGRADVLGVSLGGGVAQQFAYQSPTRVRRLVLAATSPGAISVPGRPSVMLALMTRRRYVDQAYYQRVAPKLFGGESRRDDPHSPAGARFERPPSLNGYAHQLFAGVGWTSMFWLHRITAPTLVLAGDDDPIVPAANGRLLAARIPDARLHVVRGGGHLFLLERAEELGPVIAKFLT